MTLTQKFAGGYEGESDSDDVSPFLLSVNEHSQDSPGECQNSSDFSGAVLVNCTATSAAFLPTAPQDISEILVTIRFPGKFDGLRVYLGMTNSTDDILAGAEPIAMNPGSSLYGLSSISLREWILSQKAASFGLPQVSHGYSLNLDMVSETFANWL